MASQEKKNQRRALALERLNIAIFRMADQEGKEPIILPKKAKDKDMLEIMNFERIADFLEGFISKVPGKEVKAHPLVKRAANRGVTKKKEAPNKAVSEAN